jgi:enoyl reductase-like protein
MRQTLRQRESDILRSWKSDRAFLLSKLHGWNFAVSKTNQVKELQLKNDTQAKMLRGQQNKIDELEKLFKKQGGCIVSAMSLLERIKELESTKPIKTKLYEEMRKKLDQVSREKDELLKEAVKIMFRLTEFGSTLRMVQEIELFTKNLEEKQKAK